MDRGFDLSPARRPSHWKTAALAAVLAAGCQTAVGRGQAPGPIAPAAPLRPLPVEPDPSPVVAVAEAAPVRPAGAATPAQATVQIRTVATIGSDVVITDEEVWQLVRQRLEIERRTGGPAAADPQKPREQKLFEEELLKLIHRELLLTDFIARVKKNSPARALDDATNQSKQNAATRITQFRRQSGVPSEEVFIKALQAQGVSYQGLVRQLERQALLDLYLGSILKDVGKTISLAEIERFYVANPQEFKTDDRAVWLDLFVSYSRFDTPDKARLFADWLLQQARGGADFAGLIREHGHGDSKLRGGAGIGTTPADIRPAELAPAVLALKAGQVSGLVPTETGIHIIKVTERDVAGVHAFDEKVQKFIRYKLTEQQREQEKNRLVQELWRKTGVKVVELP